MRGRALRDGEGWAHYRKKNNLQRVNNVEKFEVFSIIPSPAASHVEHLRLEDELVVHLLFDLRH